jgi:hypothetical protein
MGWDEESTKKYIRKQEVEDERQKELDMFKDNQQRQPPLGGSQINRFEGDSQKQAAGFTGGI